MADAPKKGEPRPLVVDFGGLELRDGDSVTFDVPQEQTIQVFPPDEGLEFYHGFAGYTRVERRAGAVVCIRIPPTIKGEVLPPTSGGKFSEFMMKQMAGQAGPTYFISLPPTIEGEATRIAGELPAPEGEGDGSV